MFEDGGPFSLYNDVTMIIIITDEQEYISFSNWWCTPHYNHNHQHRPTGKNCSPGGFFHIALLGTAMYHSLSGQPKPCGQQATRFWDPQSRAWNAWNILKAQVPITIAVASTDLPVFLTKISSKQKSVEELCRPWHRELAHSRPSHEAIPLLLTSPAMSKYRWQHGTVWIHVVQ